VDYFPQGLRCRKLVFDPVDYSVSVPKAANF